MEPKSIVSAVVVTIGTAGHWRNCLASLGAQTFSRREIILIDNSATSRVSAEAAAHFPGARLIRNPRNLFYAAGLNQGIAASGGDFVLCLNDDVVLAPTFIEEALKGFDVGKNIGMVSGRILRSDGKTIDSTGLFLSAFLTPTERGYGTLDRGQCSAAGPVFGVTGAVAFYRRAMLEALADAGAYFDPGYQMFYEDLELAWRAQRRGWRGYYVPSAIAYHLRGASCRRPQGLNRPCARRYLSDALHTCLVQNRYRTLARHLTVTGFLLHAAPLLLYECMLWAFLLFCRPAVAKKSIKGLFSDEKKRFLPPASCEKNLDKG